VCVLTAERAVGRIYNVTHPRNPTWSEFVAAVAAAIGVAPPQRRIPYWLALGLAALTEAAAGLTGGTPRLTPYAVRVVGRQYDYRIDRVRAEVGFEPRIGLLAGVRQCLTGPG
jgi:nucleoside-diphosphate-sugar epimerase